MYIFPALKQSNFEGIFMKLLQQLETKKTLERHLKYRRANLRDHVVVEWFSY